MDIDHPGKGLHVAFRLRRRTRSTIGTGRRRVVVGSLLILACTTGCSVPAGSALLVSGTAVPESTVQEGTSAFLAQNPTAVAGDVDRSVYNRAQLTFRIRHDLIARALATAGTVVTPQQVASASASLQAQQGASLAAQLDLPAAATPDVIHDLLGLQALVGKIPAAGVPVRNDSVTAEGVPARNRDEAVALRARFLSDPAAMDRAVAAAGAQGLSSTKFDLLKQPQYGLTGLYQAAAGSILILPQKDGYLVLRTTDRKLSTATLEPARFSSVGGAADAFNLGAMLVAGQPQGADISVNPRYGVWDPVSVQVVPGNDGL